LIAKGLVLSRIQSRGQKASLESSSDIRAGIPLLLSWYSLCNVIKAPTSVQMDAFCRTICYDRFYPGDFEANSPLEVMEMILSAIAILAEEICPEEIADPKLAALKGKYSISKWWYKAWAYQICYSINHRRFFISDSELIGMGPDRTKVGDIICILLGCSTPVILRPQDGHYIFLGEAYVHCYMYAKGMDQLAEGAEVN
jgi:hypothetical protein